MRPTAWRLLAAASLIVAASAATRPHYGGTLRVQMKERATWLDLVFDSLVTFSESAQPQRPWLSPGATTPVSSDGNSNCGRA
jgi:hypothetical protein